MNLVFSLKRQKISKPYLKKTGFIQEDNWLLLDLREFSSPEYSMVNMEMKFLTQEWLNPKIYLSCAS